MNELLAGIRQRLEGDRVLEGIALVLTGGFFGHGVQRHQRARG